MGRLEQGISVADIGTRCHPQASHHGSQSIGHVITVEVRHGQHIILFRAQKNLLKHSVCDPVLDHNLVCRNFSVKFFPQRRFGNGLFPEFFFDDFVPPGSESPFGKLHDVSFVNQSDAGLFMFYGIFYGPSHQSAGSESADRL